MSIRIASRFRAVSTGLSFGDRARGRYVHGVRREALFGELEGDPGPGRGFKEQIDDGLPAEAGTFLIGRSLTSLNGSAVSRMSRI
jgi:hypothetical protein